MPVAHSFSASLQSLLPAVTSNSPEVLFDLDDHQRALHSASNYVASQLVAPVLWDSTIQIWEQFINKISVEFMNVTAGTGITHFPEAVLAVTGSDDQQDEIDTIPTSYEDRYWLRRPIPVKFENIAADAVIAHFYKAELAVTGSDQQDAKVSLASWIFDIFEDLAAANPHTLGRTPALQIRLLNEYISRRA